MKLNVQQLDSFKKISPNIYGTQLNVTKVVTDVLLQVKKILTQQGKLSYELECDIKSIVTRAYILDKIFNPIFGNNTTGEFSLDLDLTDSDFQNTIVNLNLFQDYTPEEKQESLIYYHTPAVGVFFKGKPLFLNFNYVEALGASDEETLKDDIIHKRALEKYYKDDYHEIANNAVKKLQSGEGYSGVILETRKGKKISWNSFGSQDGLEIRIGNDITQGQFKNHQTFEKEYEGVDLDTMNLIKGFLRKINGIIGFHNDINTKLALFGILSTIIDKVWSSGQFLMNITIDDEVEGNMLFNDRYSDALKRTKSEILGMEKEKLWAETYNEETLRFIQGLFGTLESEGYYIGEFPMQNKNGVQSIYSWLRFLIQDNDFGINRTFGIGTSSLSKNDAELAKFFQENL